MEDASLNQLFVIRYTKGTDTKFSVPMSKRLAEKQAQLLLENGFEVEVLFSSEAI